MGHTNYLPQTFQTKVRIHFRDADPAGILFFGHIMSLAHDVFEEFLQKNEIPWDEWFKNSTWACPIRHSEVDFLSPLYPGREYEVEVKVSKLSQTSFSMHYEFKNETGKLCSRVQMIHAFVNQSSFQKMDIPERYRQLLSRYCLEGTKFMNSPTP